VKDSCMRRKKRKYTFRKGRQIPIESGSLAHLAEKGQKETIRTLQRALGTRKKKKSRKK